RESGLPREARATRRTGAASPPHRSRRSATRRAEGTSQMPTLNKHEQPAQLREELSHAPAFILVDHTGITVGQASQHRIKDGDANCRYQVYKSSVIHYAVTGTKHEPATALLKGMTGIAFSAEDPGAAARVARDFAKDAKGFKIKGG